MTIMRSIILVPPMLVPLILYPIVPHSARPSTWHFSFVTVSENVGSISRVFSQTTLLISAAWSKQSLSWLLFVLKGILLASILYSMYTQALTNSLSILCFNGTISILWDIKYKMILTDTSICSFDLDMALS